VVAVFSPLSPPFRENTPAPDGVVGHYRLSIS
jgi:hypothetical protein